MSKKLVIVLTAVAAVVLVVGILQFTRAHRTKPHQTEVHQTVPPSSYVGSMHAIQAAKNEWAFETKKTTNDVPTWADLLPYLRSEFTNYVATNGVVVGPGGGIITIGRVGESPSCLIDGRRVYLYH